MDLYEFHYTVKSYLKGKKKIQDYARELKYP